MEKNLSVLRTVNLIYPNVLSTVDVCKRVVRKELKAQLYEPSTAGNDPV